jgi:hypothetical protein
MRYHGTMRLDPCQAKRGLRAGETACSAVAGLVLALAGCGSVKSNATDAGTGNADAPQADAASPDAPVNACDPNGDGLKETASCQSGQTYLRFVNATNADVVSVFANNATNPVVSNLSPGAEFTVGPVDIGLQSLQFRGANQIVAMGEANTTNGSRWTVVAYRATGTNSALSFATGVQLAAGACGADQAQVAFGQFTTIAQNPAVILYSTNNGTSWTAPISPGLNTGQIFGSGCWTNSQLLFGAGPANATTPTVRYAPFGYTGGLTYQVLMTDSEVIRIDNLDRVDRFAKQ